MLYLKFIILCLVGFSLTACSSFYEHQGVIQDRNKDYLKATSIPPLKVPPGVSSNSIQPRYPVPTENYPDSEKQINLTPPDLN